MVVLEMKGRFVKKVSTNFIPLAEDDLFRYFKILFNKISDLRTNIEQLGQEEPSPSRDYKPLDEPPLAPNVSVFPLII
ncbi:hypothetical protein RRG08_017395 [Elysia crispata]|uniref:Uncharacterized protein n=1 Tax=Elysia crispata TaxID=231223 RepID=A0AAE0Z695_9GAST|nr:hypothetical protein RRG08_017395 [Elysia crispata]